MLTVEGLRKVYAEKGGKGLAVALNNVSFSVKEGEFFTLLGPSGCGKTTTLQSVAGLETPDAGRIAMGGEDVFSSERRIVVPPNQRNLGMVFQSYAIWPHMTVFENVAYPLRHGRRKQMEAEIRKAVMQSLAMVKLDHLAERPSPMLSGGQQQRVALARALVHAPRLLLLDEPLSNLDAKLRDAMREEIRNLVKALNITTIFVTHDQVEAMGMSDRVMLMRAGEAVQLGTPEDIYKRPNSVFTATFMGRSTVVDGVVQGSALAGDEVVIGTKLGLFRGIAGNAIADGGKAALILRPNAIVAGPLDGNSFPATVESVTFLGDSQEVRLRSGDFPVLQVTSPYQRVEVGSSFNAWIDPAHCIIVPAEEPAP